eukprot:TRINITY_DN6731_c0_g1_i1.p1 TRINITY_DN6731_c0_g1~~TRINITY_DN6731_c0_g1_i1.p1  ORF type:complete len:255 (+),score=41.42 TRINITY_DN6731_c0_g1_i1:26-766(+)
MDVVMSTTDTAPSTPNTTTPRRPTLMPAKKESSRALGVEAGGAGGDGAQPADDKMDEGTESRKRPAETYIPPSEQPRNKRLAAAVSGTLEAPFNTVSPGQQVTVTVEKVTNLGFHVTATFLDKPFKGIFFLREEPRPAKFLRDEQLYAPPAPAPAPKPPKEQPILNKPRKLNAKPKVEKIKQEKQQSRQPKVQPIVQNRSQILPPGFFLPTPSFSVVPQATPQLPSIVLLINTYPPQFVQQSGSQV